MKRLLPKEKFDDVFLPLQGKRVGYLKMYGNVGDRLIDWATEQMFDEYDIEYGSLNWAQGGGNQDLVLKHTDTIVFAGGGNLGRKYENCYHLRQQYFSSGLPITVLPQSLTDSNERLDEYATVYLREQSSRELFEHGIFAPDLALGFNPPDLEIDRDIDIGIFIREDEENIVGFPDNSIGDPALLCDSVMEYLRLAGRCHTIYTDRLHFAICGLICGSSVYLLPGSYYKNSAVYQSSLEQLGCKWCENISELPDVDLGHADHLFTELAIPQSRELDWQSVPGLPDWVEHETHQNEVNIKNKRLETEFVVDKHALWILNAIDSKRSIKEICIDISNRLDDTLVDVGRDVQLLIKMLRDHGMVQFENESATKNKTEINSVYFELHVEQPFTVNKLVRYQATFRLRGEEPKVIWFESSQLNIDQFSPVADAFLLSCLLPAMHVGADIRVSGMPVSKGLLANLYEFQMIFNAWYPHLQPIEITAQEVERKPNSTQSITAFSGGVDSTFSVLRQLHNPGKYANYNLTKALFVRGFDIYISNASSFDNAFDRVKSVLSAEKIELISINTNIRELFASWKRAHGLCTAAALSLFSGKYSKGIIPSTIPYKMLYPFGSNAITDRLLGSKCFEIIHDGAEHSRIEKLKFLSQFPEAIRNLRFCFRITNIDRNCGKCKKCVVTAVLLAACECDLDCFDDPPTENFISIILNRYSKSMLINELEFQELKDANDVLQLWNEKPTWIDGLQNLVDQVTNRYQPTAITNVN